MAGRPTKYSKAAQKKADDYVDGYDMYQEITKNVITKSGDVIEVTEKVPNDIPSIVGLALLLRVHRETIYNWAKSHASFFDTLERLSQKQKQFLLHHGLLRNYSDGFAKFVSINMTDMKEKIESSEEKDISVTVKNYTEK